MKRRSFVLRVAVMAAAVGAAVSGCSTTSGGGKSEETDASKRQKIDAEVDGTMSRLYAMVGGSQELVSKARGVLVFPSIVKAAFIAGAAYGEGSLRVSGSTVGYYSSAAASFGFQAGAQSTAIIFLFMTQEALDKFRNSAGWSVGGDVQVSLLKVGANGTLDTRTATAPVSAIVMTNTGLMADASLSGTKVTKLNL
ncbi:MULTISPECIES: YSC84-related protein [unclassified Paraburkholderia]|uniref:BPSL1445 family SYLF domain-containing lipoprotein n=1 Tax=unclassified Paraburkholderia TaxID=2615204 RepID=UPI00286EF12F|nr:MULTISPECIES: YSC84-related protein [unclassified Paraburkholderia]